MSYEKFIKNREKIHKKLFEFHEEYKKELVHNAVGPEIFKPKLINWFNTICKTYCGLTTKSKFRCQTIWSQMNGPKEGALCIMGFRADRFSETADTIQYRLFLMHHNTQADTDMSDDSIFYIDFTIYKEQQMVSEYSFVFG